MGREKESAGCSVGRGCGILIGQRMPIVIRDRSPAWLLAAPSPDSRLCCTITRLRSTAGGVTQSIHKGTGNVSDIP